MERPIDAACKEGKLNNRGLMIKTDMCIQKSEMERPIDTANERESRIFFGKKGLATTWETVQMGNKIILFYRMHDRSVVKQLKWFHKKNLNVARNPLREQRLREGDSVFTTTEFNWEDLGTVRHVTDALLNYGIVMQYLWPYDQSAWLLLKLYMVYGWLQYGVSKKRRTAMICDHFERVSVANADKAVCKVAPCDYLECERLLKMVLAEEGLSLNPPIFHSEVEVAVRGDQDRGGPPQRGARGGRGGRGQFGRGAARARPPAVTPNGKRVCYKYNSREGCANQVNQNDTMCKNQHTQAEFVHACLWVEAGTSNLCLKNHPKYRHK